MLDVSDSLNFLKLEGLPVVKSVKTDTIDGVRLAFEKLRPPLVMKLVSHEHKTDVGGVVMGINSYGEAVSVFGRLSKMSKQVLVQEQVKGLELALGVKKDPVFGQVIMFGLGGVFIELLRDVSFRVCPISKSEAKAMINELKAKQLLKGYRGGEKVNVNALAEIIVKLSRVVVRSDVKDLDINPLIASRKKLVIVDARLTL
jgi:acyl-CoA synthetase (NDP forming)